MGICLSETILVFLRYFHPRYTDKTMGMSLRWQLEREREKGRRENGAQGCGETHR